MSIIIKCEYEGESHVFPDDWIFGGANGLHPGADPRFPNTHYQYLDADLTPVFVTGAWLCDDEALFQFTKIANYGFHPVYITVLRPGNNKYELMPFKYVELEDTVYDWKIGSGIIS